MSRPRVALVVAMAENRVIGKGGTLPWRLPEDMKWFREITMGKPCIMGRKTWESLPKRPLPGRTNIVVTRNRFYRAEGAATVVSIDEAIAAAMGERPDEIIVIGGSQIYAEVLARTDRIYLTRVHAVADGDAYFPEIDGALWRSTQRMAPRTSSSGLSFDIVQLDKV
jgi:dihydrofolate reductase